ncbi:hypothetical protein L1987_17356 [Smallanthus sonchifolius]|uniref:Uncharacterized protein n=1 Tax=Smallanthus sonchifolius TaxID=185202 RepID=A0ACB9IXK3_9ASTR|nr:hypothetical protein L1987_17356 [Smallanthus sonchifolius]
MTKSHSPTKQRGFHNPEKRGKLISNLGFHIRCITHKRCNFQTNNSSLPLYSPSDSSSPPPLNTTASSPHVVQLVSVELRDLALSEIAADCLSRHVPSQ